MRVTILTLGSRGDVQPFLAFGLGLASAGHEVCVATHLKYKPLVDRVGLEFAPLAEGRLSAGPSTIEGRRWMERGSRRLPTWVGFVKDARSVARRRLSDAIEASKRADAIVASNLATLLGWQMADRFGVPLVRVRLNPPRSRAGRPNGPVAAGARQAAWLAARPWLQSVRHDVGLPPPPRRQPFAELDRRELLVLYPCSPTVTAKPARAGDHVNITGYWFLERDLDQSPPVELFEFLDAGPPPVCVGFGSMLDSDPAATAGSAIDALRRAGARGILLAGQYGLRAGDVPEDIFVLDSVSHHWLFPRCSAVVHHAAAGTTAAALRAGVPSVPVPHMSDQFTWARRIHELGVSTPPMRRRELSADRLHKAIAIASTDRAMRRRAADLGERIRAEDGVARAVELFDRHVAPEARSRAARALVR